MTRREIKAMDAALESKSHDTRKWEKQLRYFAPAVAAAAAGPWSPATNIR